MSPNQTLLSIEEYLHTSYRPDCDYVDGQVLERNMGEKPHARLQGFFVKLLGRYEEDFGFEVLPELRLQTKETRFCIPDVMVLPASNLDTPSLRPHRCFASRFYRAKIAWEPFGRKLASMPNMSVATCWVVDPWRRTVQMAGADGVLREVSDTFTLPGTPIFVEVNAIFAELDRL